MANEDVQKLVAVVEARSATAEKQMERFVRAADRRMAEFERRASQAAVKVEAKMTTAFTKIGAAARNLGTTLVAALGVTSITSVFDRVLSAAKRFDELGDTANRLGTSAGELVKWRSALELTAGSMEGFNASAEAFQGKIGALIGGIGKTKATKDALAKIGLSREDLAAATTLERRLLLIAEAISQVEDRAVRAAIADKLGLRPMLPLLEQGREGVEKLTAQFQGVADAADEGVKRTGDLADRVNLLQQEMQIKSDNLFVRLGPIIAAVYQGVSDLLDLMRDPLFGRAFTVLAPGFDVGAGLARAVKSPGIKREIASLEKDLAALAIGGVGMEDGAYRRMSARLEKLKGELAAYETGATAAAEATKTIANVEFTGAGGGGGDLEGELDAAAKAAAKAAEEFRALEKARADWRNDPEAKFDTRQSLEGISDRGSDQVGKMLEPLQASAEAAANLREEFRNAFRYAFSQLSQGDFEGAALTFVDAFAQKLQDRVSDQLFDFVWDSLGLGDVAGQLFGPLDAAQAAQAATTTQATTAINLMANAAYNAASALASVAGSGGGGGGFLGAITSAIGSVFGGGGVLGASQNFSNSVGIGGWFPGRASGGPVTAGQPYIVGEKRPELFVPNTSGYIVPRVPSAVSRGTSMTFAPVINAPGADPAAITRIEAMMARERSEFQAWAASEKARVRSHVSSLRSSRML